MPSKINRGILAAFLAFCLGLLIAIFVIPVRQTATVEIGNSGWHKKDPGIIEGVSARGPLDVEIDSGEGVALEIALPVDPVGRWVPESLAIDYSQWRIKDETKDRIVSTVPHAKLRWVGEQVSPFSIGLITEGQSTKVTLSDNLSSNAPIVVSVKNDGKFRNATHTPNLGTETKSKLLSTFLMTRFQDETNLWWGNKQFSSEGIGSDSLGIVIFLSIATAVKLAIVILLVAFASFIVGRRLKSVLNDGSAGSALSALTGFLATLLLAGALNYFVNGKIVAIIIALMIALLIAEALINNSHRSALVQDLSAFKSNQFIVALGFLGLASLTVSAYANWTVGLAQTDVFDYFYGIHSGLNNSYFSGNIVTGNGMRSLDFASRSLWGSALPDMQSISLWAISGLFIATVAISESLTFVAGKAFAIFMPVIPLVSGAFAGMWTEAYMSRWFVAFCALYATFLIFILAINPNFVGPISILALFLLTVSQLVIVPVFLAVPAGTALALILAWRKRKSESETWPTEINRILKLRSTRIILTVTSSLAVINLLWLRSLGTTLALTSDQLNGIAKWIVLPFYNQPEFTGTLSGLLPWHGITQSRWGVPTAVPGSSIYSSVIEPIEAYFSYWAPVKIGFIATSIICIAIFLIRKEPKKKLWQQIVPTLLLVGLIVLQGAANTLFSDRSLYTVLMYFVTLAPAVFVGSTAVICYLLSKNSKFGLVGKLSTAFGIAGVAIFIFVNFLTSSVELSRWNDSTKHILGIEAIALDAVENGYTAIKIEKAEPMTDYEYVYIANVFTSRIQDLGITCANCVQQENRISSTTSNPSSVVIPETTGILIVGGSCRQGLTEVSKYDWFTLCKVNQ